MASGSRVMCRKEVDTPWSIYRDFTVNNNTNNKWQVFFTVEQF